MFSLEELQFFIKKNKVGIELFSFTFAISTHPLLSVCVLLSRDDTVSKVFVAVLRSPANIGCLDKSEVADVMAIVIFSIESLSTCVALVNNMTYKIKGTNIKTKVYLCKLNTISHDTK